MPDDKKPEYESIKVDYILECTYTPDWEFTALDGSKFYLETKGKLDTDTRRKMLAVKKCNPTLDVRLVFQRDNPLYKGSKTKYSEWAELNGFKHHTVGNTNSFIPREWLREAKAFTVCKEGIKYKNGNKTK